MRRIDLHRFADEAQIDMALDAAVGIGCALSLDLVAR